MLTGKNIYKRYGAVEVLNGVNIEVNKGEVVSIVGPSGSGKSTLLHILSTLDNADIGTVEFNGMPIRVMNQRNFQPVKWLRRLANYVLDSIAIGFLANGLMILFGEQESLLRLSWPPSYLIYLYTAATLIFYYTFMEGLTGRTIGKYITGTKVIMAMSSSKPSLMNSLVRSLCRFIPFDAFSFLRFFPIGWHDSASMTAVVDSKFLYLKGSDNYLSGKQLAAFRNKHIGFVFQFHHLLPEFTALENVCIPGWLAGRKKKEVMAEAEKLLNMLGLSERLNNKPNQLSGGEQQRVAVARALINKPDIIFADEPTGNLDSANAQELHQLFFDLRKQFNQTFLIVTHNEELAALSDRVLHMKDGKIV